MIRYVITRHGEFNIGFMLDNDKVSDICVYEKESCLGNIYVARVSNIVPNINAAFVDIKKGVSCYLSLEDYCGTKPLKKDDLVTVQVIKDNIKTKRAAVTTNISMSDSLVSIQQQRVIGVSAKIKDKDKRKELKELLNEKINEFYPKRKYKQAAYGGILRTKCSEAAEDEIINSTVNLLCKLDEILYKSNYSAVYSCLYRSTSEYMKDIIELSGADVQIITDNEDIIDECMQSGVALPELYKDDKISLASRFGTDRILSKSLSKYVYLKSGAYLVIEVTEALTVIDVNSGKAVKGSDRNISQYNINLEAACEVARQLRLRNLSGIIIVDFISMKSENEKKELLERLTEYTTDDKIQTKVLDITELGLVELTRKKIKRPLHEYKLI